MWDRSCFRANWETRETLLSEFLKVKMDVDKKLRTWLLASLRMEQGLRTGLLASCSLVRGPNDVVWGLPMPCQS